MTCWLVGESVADGRVPRALVWIGRIALAVFLGALFLLLFRRKKNRAAEICRRIAVCTFFALLSIALGLYLVYTGPANRADYPPAATSPYRLPWPSGKTHLCIQSNRGIVSHRGHEEFSFDFAMPVGSVFCAARAGAVVAVIDEHDGNGVNAPNNIIFVRHDDNTFGVYAHLQIHGSLVQPGQKVAQGEPLGLSGNVGVSMLPHLHFHVQANRDTVPISFADVPGDGIPRMFGRYVSGNK
jgi:murein DD-endopeptidase MepM/ murein hydrolase activator NlpD